VVAGCVSAGVALAQPASSPLSSLVGTWVGSYTCAQGLTGLSLQISPGQGGSVPILLDFYPVPANPTVPQGSARFSGALSTTTTVELTPVSWIKHPAGWYMVNLAGSLSPAGGKTLSGSVIGCSSSFSLSRLG
jgi:hypothetical protein